MRVSTITSWEGLRRRRRKERIKWIGGEGGRGRGGGGGGGGERIGEEGGRKKVAGERDQQCGIRQSGARPRE